MIVRLNESPVFQDKVKHVLSEWGEEVEWWREQLWPKFEDSIFEFENHEVVQVFHHGKLHVHRIK